MKRVRRRDLIQNATMAVKLMARLVGCLISYFRRRNVLQSGLHATYMLNLAVAMPISLHSCMFGRACLVRHVCLHVYLTNCQFAHSCAIQLNCRIQCALFRVCSRWPRGTGGSWQASKPQSLTAWLKVRRASAVSRTKKRARPWSCLCSRARATVRRSLIRGRRTCPGTRIPWEMPGAAPTMGNAEERRRRLRSSTKRGHGEAGAVLRI